MQHCCKWVRLFRLGHKSISIECMRCCRLPNLLLILYLRQDNRILRYLKDASSFGTSHLVQILGAVHYNVHGSYGNNRYSILVSLAYLLLINVSDIYFWLFIGVSFFSDILLCNFFIHSIFFFFKFFIKFLFYWNDFVCVLLLNFKRYD